MKKIILSGIITLLLASPVLAQVDKEFEEAQKAMKKEMNEYIQKSRQDFNDYVDKMDKEFSGYLRKTWSEFNMQKAIKPDTTPKPKVLPKFNPAVDKIKPNEGPKEIPVASEPIPEIQPLPPVPNIPIILKDEPEEKQAPTPESLPVAEKFNLEYFGNKLLVDADKELNGSLPAEIHNTTIADFWDRMNKANYMSLIKWFTQESTRMNLNDWGYYLLVKKTAEFINPDPNYSRLLTWFLLTKSGYKTKVAYTDNEICLLFPSATTIYGMRYFMLDNVRYYAPDFQANQIFTYEKDFPGASKVIDMNVYNALNLGNNYNQKSIKITYRDKDYSFTVDYNKNAIEFYRNYPQCDLKVYFDAAISPRAKETLLNSLKPVTDKLSPTEGVDFLLSVVQNGFAYKDDQEQFDGKEKFFFPEEDFYYPFNDCDDRAVLFAYLVKELLHLKIIGVTYPGHVATAVHFTTDVPGDFVTYKSEKYWIADPTFINAPFGMTMPAYKNATAEIIDLENTQNQEQLLAGLWEKVENGGGRPGDNIQTSVTDKEGNIYIAGYYKGEASFGGATIKSAENCRDAFLAKFNAHGNPEWVIKGGSDGNAMANNIRMDDNENIYVSGTFEQNIAFGSILIIANSKSNVFLAKFNRDGKVLWMNQLPLEKETGADYIYVSSFSSKGKADKIDKFPADPNYSKYGISFDASGNVFYTSTYSSTAGMMDNFKVSSTAEYSVLNSLKAETDKQLNDNCEKAIAGLFAAVSLMKSSNVVLSGKIVQDAFERYNPGFKQTAPKLYDLLGKVKMMKNDQGIVIVQTSDEKALTVDKLKINNDSRLRISILPNGDSRLDVLSGVKVGKAFIWFNLNYVKLCRSNGNVIFDYDTDHSQATLNLKKDMFF